MKVRLGIASLAILLASTVILCAIPGAGFAAGPPRVTVNGTTPESLTITAGKSVILESPGLIKRFSIAAPQVADAVVLTPRQLYLTGKSPGVTNLTLWGEGDKLAAVFDIEVASDIASLKSKLHEVFPDEKGIRVTATRDSITITGVVSNNANLAQVLSLAQAYAPVDKDGKPKLVSLLEVGGVHQVMLEVRVSEMSRSLARNLGINFNTVSSTAQQFGVSGLDNLANPGNVQGFTEIKRLPIVGPLALSPQQAGFPISPLPTSSSVNQILRFLGGGATWTVFIDALKENDLVKVLAEPTLITTSGKSANFLAGGEYPIPVPQSGGVTTVITIQYKTFGVSLNFTPTVLSDGRINMQVAPEVSELDFSNAVTLQGFVIPSLTTRRVSTTVELGDGQSFAIAGLMREDVREVAKKYPLLGDIPILGALFRSSQFQKNETELVVIVTPHLVKPLDLAKQTLPTDQFVEPNDLEFYLLGRIEGRGPGPAGKGLKASRVMNKGGGLDGDFGHIVP
jgi:pilus assembly protein CpaC